jgi:hypothetical protein
VKAKATDLLTVYLKEKESSRYYKSKLRPLYEAKRIHQIEIPAFL